MALVARRGRPRSAPSSSGRLPNFSIPFNLTEFRIFTKYLFGATLFQGSYRAANRSYFGNLQILLYLQEIRGKHQKRLT